MIAKKRRFGLCYVGKHTPFKEVYCDGDDHSLLLKVGDHVVYNGSSNNVVKTVLRDHLLIVPPNSITTLIRRDLVTLFRRPASLTAPSETTDSEKEG